MKIHRFSFNGQIVAVISDNLTDAVQKALENNGFTLLDQADEVVKLPNQVNLLALLDQDPIAKSNRFHGLSNYWRKQAGTIIGDTDVDSLVKSTIYDMADQLMKVVNSLDSLNFTFRDQAYRCDRTT